jgi:hypothetical protein
MTKLSYTSMTVIIYKIMLFELFSVGLIGRFLL